MIRASLVPPVLALLGLGAGACSGGAPAAAGPPLPGDEDTDAGGHRGYYDGDDGEARYFGRAADPQQARAITTLVQSYYAAAAAGDGAEACALTYHISVETIPEKYGQPPGPLYLRGARTCPAVLSIVFKHFHSQLTTPVTVTGVRIGKDRADALLGFRALPAGVLRVRREYGAWKVDGLLAVALP